MTSSVGSADRARFILDNTRLQAPPHVPEIRLHLADEAFELWRLTETELAERGLPMPFWAFAWAGGQALARYVLDHPETVAGRSVFVFAAGSGMEAIAAVKAGAAAVTASDIDPFAAVAMELNAVANGAAFTIERESRLGGAPTAEVYLFGDVFYERPMAGDVAAWAADLAAAGRLVLIGDPGRSYLPADRLDRLADYSVPTSRALEDSEIKRTAVFRFRP